MNTPILRAVALVGATGTGKSALAMQLCHDRDTCIVCCDSMQVYRGLDIGSAKPTAAEQRQVPHALLDCCELPDQFSAARWAREAAAVIRRENTHNRIPLIVGGSGFYLRALLEGFADIPEAHPEVQQRLREWHRQYGTRWLHQRLQACDPAMAARLQATDSQRIMRALAVFESTGIPLSAWQQRPATREPIDCPVFVLEMPRAQLRERLRARFLAMLDAGWLDEVRWLDAHCPDPEHPARRAVGYRQLLAHLHGACTLEQATEQGITATRRYAKRQVTWFAHQLRDAIHGDAAQLAPAIAARLAR